MENLYSDIPDELPDELFTDLLRGRGFRVERIVSRGHCSPPSFWYDQPQAEWVLLLRGRATLTMDQGEPVTLTMSPGDHLLIPAHVRHRVEDTAPGGDTVWLTIHFDPPTETS